MLQHAMPTTEPTSSADKRVPSAEPSVVYRAMPDGGVLFSPKREFYYGLNLPGACIWENLAPVSSTLDELCAAVEARFPDADPDRIRTDVRTLLAKLLEHGLVTW